MSPGKIFEVVWIWPKDVPEGFGFEVFFDFFYGLFQIEIFTGAFDFPEHTESIHQRNTYTYLDVI